MLFFFLRHGDPIYDPDSLTPLGARQAEALARRLALYGVDEIYVSSSPRARQTAQPTCEILGKEPVVLDWCNEKYAWGYFAVPYRGQPKGRWGFQHTDYRRWFREPETAALGKQWYTRDVFAGTDFAEGAAHYQRETDAFFRRLGYVHDAARNGYIASPGSEKRVALFAHRGFGMAFLSSLLDVPYPMFATSFDMGHTGMTVIEFASDEELVIPVVLQLANDSHLYRDGLPTHYQNRLRF